MENTSYNEGESIRNYEIETKMKHPWQTVGNNKRKRISQQGLSHENRHKIRSSNRFQSLPVDGGSENQTEESTSDVEKYVI